MFPGKKRVQSSLRRSMATSIHTLRAPEGGTDVGHPVATDYFAGRGNFIPTDVEQLDGMMYMTTGYSNLDYVLTARILATNPFKVQWHYLAFGGRGTGIGHYSNGARHHCATWHKESLTLPTGQIRRLNPEFDPLWLIPLDVADALSPAPSPATSITSETIRSSVHFTAPIAAKAPRSTFSRTIA